MARKTSEETLSSILEHGISLKNRTITVAGEIDDELVKIFSLAFDEFDYSSEPVTIKLYSHGGDARAAMAIIGLMRASPCTVIVEAYGQVESAATLILAAGNKRLISAYSYFMHHESSYTLVDEKHSNIKARVKQEQREEEFWAETMAGFTKKPASFWLKHGVGDDFFMSPQQLVEAGVVEAII